MTKYSHILVTAMALGAAGTVLADGGESHQLSLVPKDLATITAPTVVDQALQASANPWIPEKEQGLSIQRNTLLLAEAASTPVPTADDDAELAKKTLNPVANLISVPFQYNADFGIGPKNASKSTLNIEPVIPISLNKDWNVISRTILPVIYADSPADGVSTNWGLGDINPSLFFSPKEPTAGWIWGVGPVFLLPTATDTSLGTGKWSAGPTMVLLQQQHGWTYGMLANHLWSFAGDGDRRSVNATFLQPFISYTFPTFTSLTLNTESTYDWTNKQWTVPVNLMVSQILKIGKLPVSVQLGGRYYAEGPSGGPEWGLRFTFTFLFPK